MDPFEAVLGRVGVILQWAPLGEAQPETAWVAPGVGVAGQAQQRKAAVAVRVAAGTVIVDYGLDLPGRRLDE